MAPEILLPETVEQAGAHTDVWSLGATLYFMVHGQPPWNATTHDELSRKVRNDELRFPKEIISRSSPSPSTAGTTTITDAASASSSTLRTASRRDSFNIAALSSPPSSPTMKGVTVTIDPGLRHLIFRMLTKDPEKRPSLQWVKEHDWITHEGTEPMPEYVDIHALHQSDDDDENGSGYSGTDEEDEDLNNQKKGDDSSVHAFGDDELDQFADSVVVVSGEEEENQSSSSSSDNSDSDSDDEEVVDLFADDDGGGDVMALGSLGSQGSLVSSSSSSDAAATSGPVITKFQAGKRPTSVGGRKKRRKSFSGNVDIVKGDEKTRTTFMAAFEAARSSVELEQQEQQQEEGDGNKQRSGVVTGLM
jgi:serine/threonine protein kinase